MKTPNKFGGLMPTDKEIMMRSIFENPIVSREVFSFLCGPMLGYGISRAVFEYAPDPKRWVVKIECDHYNANVVEWNAWQRVQFTDHAKWFAPCGIMSPCGRVMLQRRCKPIKSYSEYPQKVPAHFTDLKYQNWGKLNGVVVCMDYASNLLIEEGMTKKMRVAKWWDATGGYGS